MKILKNKTYKNLLLKIEVLESDKERLIKKCDSQQIDFIGLSGRFELQRNQIKDQTDFISSLNERVQKAEAKIEEYRVLNTKIEFKNKDLIAENVELKSKLSRKGTGTKGSKKQ